MKLLKNKMNSAKNWILYFVYLLIGILFVTGITQMPVSKRYSIDALPFLKWTSDFYITNYAHYTAALILVFIAFYYGTIFIIRHKGSFSFTTHGYIILYMSGIIFLTGMLNSLSAQISGVIPQSVLIGASFFHIITAMIYAPMLLFVLSKKKKLLVRN